MGPSLLVLVSQQLPLRLVQVDQLSQSFTTEKGRQRLLLNISSETLVLSAAGSLRKRERRALDFLSLLLHCFRMPTYVIGKYLTRPTFHPAARRLCVQSSLLTRTSTDDASRHASCSSYRRSGGSCNVLGRKKGEVDEPQSSSDAVSPPPHRQRPSTRPKQASLLSTPTAARASR